MKIIQEGTNVLDRNLNEFNKGTRIVINQGGRGSSKTWSIAQLFLGILLGKKDVVLTVCRKTLPALRASAMKDFFEIMNRLGIYRVENHNKTERIYRYKNNEIEFISVDEQQKVRGRKRHYLWMNEMNEFAYEDFKQLNMRTERQIFGDFNPSDEFHWIYDNVLTRDDCTLIKSTYLDNLQYLDPAIVKEIERFRELDKNYWRIYGLGERGISEAKVFSNWEYCDKLPEGDSIFGEDFGFNDPSAIVEIVIKEKNLYIDERLYQTHLTNSELIEKMKALEVSKERYIYADSAEPQRIEEIKQAGFNVIGAEKGQGVVKKQIDDIKSYKIYITKRSTNLLKEFKSLSYKTKGEQILDEILDVNAHLIAGLRYAVHGYKNIIVPDIHII